MKVAVFSDMHGNSLGFEAVLDDLAGEKIDQMVCLGDTIQGGPQPAETLSRLRSLGCPVVMGNADAWLISGIDSGAENMDDARRAKMEQVRHWSLAQLSTSDQDYVITYKPTVGLELEGGRVLLCSHGSPKSFDDVLLPTISDEELKGFLEPQDNWIYTGGHTHVQFVRQLRRAFFFNPGSAGTAYRQDQDMSRLVFDSWSEYAVLSIVAGKVRLEFRRVPFDSGRLKQIYRKSGRPYAEESISQIEG